MSDPQMPVYAIRISGFLVEDGLAKDYKCEPSEKGFELWKLVDA